jgi:DNA-binding winged helix-turn-helix (wHTH) protein
LVVYRFGDFTLHTSTRQLRSSAAEVHLSPKAFDLLVTLLANRSRAVSKAELQERLWPSTFVEETNLAGLVAEIRRALRDPASNPALVGTVYGFGYRFIGEVRVDQDGERPPLGRSRLYLVFEQRELLLMDGANVIGRAPDATIQIDSPGVSRYHARVVVSDGEATIEDVESKNGTFVNGQRITAPQRVNDGGEIRLGGVRLTLRVASTTSRTSTMPAPEA